MLVVPKTYNDTPRYDLARAALIMAANSRTLFTYTGIAELVGFPTVAHQMISTVGRLIGEISDRESEEGRPMLSAIVVDKNSGLAGPGFFKLVRDRNLLTSTSKAAEKRFLDKEKTKVFDYWKLPKLPNRP
jgi:hypothetical protein